MTCGSPDGWHSLSGEVLVVVRRMRFTVMTNGSPRHRQTVRDFLRASTASTSTAGRGSVAYCSDVAQVRLDSITKTFGDVTAVDDVTLTVGDHDFMILLGPSGCGKSTLLRMIAGLEAPTVGDVYIGDVRVNDVEPKQRDVAMVFQSYALYPHKTVQANIEFPLKVRGVAKAERAAQAVEAADSLGLSDQLLAATRTAQRRATPARRARPRDRPPSGGVLHGRAAVATSMPSCAARRAPSWSRCTAGCRRRSSTSPTTRSRR